MLRSVIFYFGCLLMALSLLWPLMPAPDPARFNRMWLFDFGLLLAVASHGWPGGL